MLVPTDKRSVCWHCRQPIAYFQPTEKSWIEASSLQRPGLAPRWLHTEEAKPYWDCKINGFHPGPGTAKSKASPQSNLVRIVVVVGVIVALILAFVVYSFATYEPLVI
jgi:hypothetical protein